MARAISSLPVPLSPVRRTVEETLPIRSIVRKISCIRLPLPMMLANVYLPASSWRRYRFSSWSSFSPSARRTMRTSSSLLKGLEM